MSTAIGAYDYKENGLLAALSDTELERLIRHLEPVTLEVGGVLYEPNALVSYLHFPISAIVSLLHVMKDGSATEIAVVGKEGVVGVSVFMGGQTTTSRAVVRSRGRSYRLRRQVLIDEFNQGGSLQRLLLRYTQTLLTQMSQTAVCNRHHTLDQQLCRWLLFSLDRLPSYEIKVTQELIAHMLGVRREGVTEAAGKLQTEGLISNRRGQITVLDRAGLERRSCECYRIVKAEMDRLLPSGNNHNHHPPLPSVASK